MDWAPIPQEAPAAGSLLLRPLGWDAPFVLRAEARAFAMPDGESLEQHVRWRHRGEYFARGLHSVAAARPPQRLPPRRAIRRLQQDAARPAYLLLTVPPSRWRRLAAGVEPEFVSQASRRPEGECAAALAPANVSWRFERELHWRMLVLGGAAGSGMHAHVDDPPTSAWHAQLRGRKRYVLCAPPPTHALSASPPSERGPNASSCIASVLSPGDQLYYPHGWSHETRTLDAGAASLSRLLLTPSNAPAFARRMQQHCARGLDLSFSTYGRLCAALAPCLQRLLDT